MLVNWQERPFFEMIDHCEGKTRQEVEPGSVNVPYDCEEYQILRLSDGSYIAIGGDYDAGYSEDTPGDGLSLYCFVGYPQEER